jgi:hypothetical protein
MSSGMVGIEKGRGWGPEVAERGNLADYGGRRSGFVRLFGGNLFSRRNVARRARSRRSERASGRSYQRCSRPARLAALENVMNNYDVLPRPALADSRWPGLQICRAYGPVESCFNSFASRITAKMLRQSAAFCRDPLRNWVGKSPKTGLDADWRGKVAYGRC